MFYDVTNVEQCTPENKFVGIHTGVPIGQDTEIEMTRVGENTWRGYFYRDLFHDEDYHGLGVCHWDATQVAPALVVHGQSFGTGHLVRDALKRPDVEYFRKTDFLDRTPSPYPAPSFLEVRPEYVKEPGEFFPVTVAVKEAKQ